MRRLRLSLSSFFPQQDIVPADKAFQARVQTLGRG